MLRVKITEDDAKELLTTPQATYIVNVENHLKALDKIKSKLRLVEGLYLTNSYKPLVEFSTVYYVKTDTEMKLIESSDDVKMTKSDIYIKTNDVYELHMRYSNLTKVKDRLTVTPAINYVNILLLKELVEHFMVSSLNYRYYHSKNNLYNCFKEKFQSYVTKEQYYHDFDDLYEEVMEFMNDHYWSIYFVKVINSSIRIERTADYRVYEWTLSQLKEETED